MSVIRSALEFEGHFTQLPNTWLRDTRLSWRARGVLAGLASHRVGWKVTLAAMVEGGKEGRDAVATALRELEELGYLERTQDRDDLNRFKEIAYRLADPWCGNPVPGNPYAGNPVPGNPHPKKTKEEHHLEEHQEDHSAADAAREDLDRLFELGWKEWPKKDRKKPARDKFMRLVKKHDPVWLSEQIERFGVAYGRSVAETRFVPALVVWLNQERWTDELPSYVGEETVSGDDWMNP